MSNFWTDDQTNAINSRRGSILVSAAAGSGKTAVLVERVTQRICNLENPTPVDRLLIVTFTKAAAKEMKDRISAKLRALLSEHPKSPVILRQLAALPSAHISTIDSFCSDIVREFFYKLNINKDFRIADSGELEVLKDEAMKAALDEFYIQGSDDFYALVESFSTAKSDRNIEELIFKIYNFLCSHPFGNDWIDEMLSNYDITDKDICDTVWGKIIIDECRSRAEFCLEMSKGNYTIINGDSTLEDKLTDYLNYYTAISEKYIQILDDTSLSWDELSLKLSIFEKQRFPSIRGYADNPTKNTVKSRQEDVAANLMYIKNSFKISSDEVAKQINALKPIIKTLFDCVKKYTEYYSAAKLRENVADFSDIEHWTLKLFCRKTGWKNCVYRYSGSCFVTL